MKRRLRPTWTVEDDDVLTPKSRSKRYARLSRPMEFTGFFSTKKGIRYELQAYDILEKAAPVIKHLAGYFLETCI